jgi:hypothetical protein
MPKNPETFLKERFLRDVRDFPNLWVEKIQQMTIRGTPDILGCVNGRFIAVELKAGSKVHPLQQHKLDKIHEAKGISLVCDWDNYESTLGIIQTLANLS